MKKILVFICLAVMLTVPFAACGAEAPAPVTPAPVTPAPVTPAPVTPAPVTPASPVTPSPAPVVVPAPAGEPTYTVMDPRAWEPPRPFAGLAPRLDTLAGKKIIVVNLRGGNEDAILSVGPALQAAFPTAEVTVITTEGPWMVSKTEWELIESQDAVIFGHDY